MAFNPNVMPPGFPGKSGPTPESNFLAQEQLDEKGSELYFQFACIVYLSII